MKLWVDADALPGELKDLIVRAARRLKVETVLVANKNIPVGPGLFVSSVRVTKGADVADAYIVERSSPLDLCVTADIPLAFALVEKGLVVIDPRGELYSAHNIGERLAMRDFMAGLREAGVQTGGPAPFNQQAKQKFAARLDSLLSKALRKQA
jgi:uncharacterized protein YaiI (UPF0178 family)